MAEKKRRFEGEWISPYDRDGYYWVPPGEYPDGVDLIAYAKEEYDDRLIFISRRALRQLINHLEDEGLIEKELIKTDDDIKEIAHRHLDVIETLVGKGGD